MTSNKVKEYVMAVKEEGHAGHITKAESLGFFDAVRRPLKVVFMGAGSMFFDKLFADVLNIPGTDTGEMAIVDIDIERLALAEQMGNKIVETTGKAGWKVTASANRREVLEGADYIIHCIEVSGTEAVKFDNDIPAKYGVDQCIGDTIGPGGLFKGLRTAPVFLEVLADVEELCPDAWVLNYTNPMSILCLAAARASKAKVVGFCHSVQHTTNDLADYLGLAYQDLHWRVGGINHLAWFLELSSNGQDMYPVLLEKIQSDLELYERDPIRFDMMKHFDYFITESSGHLSEYLPYYRKRPELIEKYCRDKYRGGSGFYAAEWPGWRVAKDKLRRDILAGKEPLVTDRTDEYASYTIEAIETNRPFVLYGNVLNDGLIDNLPQDGMVEVACVADGNGISPTKFGPLPPQCAALCDWQMRMYDLAADACIEKSPKKAAQALMLDPLTAAVCCPAEIKKMTEELFAAEADLLPGF